MGKNGTRQRVANPGYTRVGAVQPARKRQPRARSPRPALPCRRATPARSEARRQHYACTIFQPAPLPRDARTIGRASSSWRSLASCGREPCKHRTAALQKFAEIPRPVFQTTFCGTDVEASRKRFAVAHPVWQRGPGTMLSRARAGVGRSTFYLPLINIIKA